MKETNKTYEISFRCYYPDGEPTNHRQALKIKDIPRWIESYIFTHPNCNSITVKVWFNEQGGKNNG